MSEIKRTPIKINGRKGIIVHDRLCADGPKDPVTGLPLIDPETGEEYPGANDDMADAMHDYLTKLRSPVILKNGITAPRFGVLTLLAITTPIYVYDHPAFKEIANTAFTDGHNVFVDADFMRKLKQQEDDSGGKKSGVLWELLHELMHKLLCHVDRLKSFPPKIANIAEDMVINGKLIKAYDNIPPVPLLEEICYGMKKGDADKFYKMAEEVVAEMLWNAEKKKQKKKEEEQKQQQSGGGDGQGEPEDGEGDSNDEGNEGDMDSPGQSKDGKDGKESKSGKPGKSSGKGKSGGQDSGGKGGQGSSEDGEGGEEDKEEFYSPIHHISPEDLIDVIEKNGLHETVGKALDLPRKGDIEGLGRMKDQNKMNIIDAVQVACSEASKAGGLYPGEHIAEYASDLIGDLEKGKLSYKLIIKKLFQGEGQKLYHTDDEAGLMWYMDKETIGVEPFYIGSSIPHAPDEAVYVMVDMSGSTKIGMMRKEFLQEALNIKRSISSTGDEARKVFIQSVDTILRGEPVLVTDANINKLRHEGIPVFGDGGTSFATCLKQGLEQPMMKKEKIKVVIYFTDCIDAIPQREDFEEHLNKGIKIVFITTPGLFNEKWNNEVTWAEVYCIEDNTVVDATKDESQQVRNTRKGRVGV
jgi:predicted metal-dependent peptidase